MPSTPSRMRPAAKRAIVTVAVIALAAAMWTNTRVVSASESAAAAGEKFSAEQYATENFAKTVKPHIERAAVPAADLHQAIEADVDAAGKKYGGRDGDSAWAFPVALRGVAGKVDPIMGQLPVTVEGMGPDTQIVVQLGPAINGSALRDVTGEVHFGMFKNQLEFQSVAVQLNRQVKLTVLKDIDAAALNGKTIEVVGAFTSSDSTLWVVTPVSLKVAS